MIPVRDTIQSRHFPFVNIVFILLNVFFYGIQLSLGGEADTFMIRYALVPARYTDPGGVADFGSGQAIPALFTFMFIHGSFWHLLGNMWFLYIFGDNVEDRLGSLSYLLFYLLCGLASGFTHILLNPHSTVPTIGASGAVAGVMGAYFLLYPRARIVTLVPLLFIPWFIEIPAILFLALWFLMQFLNATLAGDHTSGIAWWAHIGGFVFGALIHRIFYRKT